MSMIQQTFSRYSLKQMDIFLEAVRFHLQEMHEENMRNKSVSDKYLALSDILADLQPLRDQKARIESLKADEDLDPRLKYYILDYSC